MYDQSFNSVTIARTLRKSDFLAYPYLRDPVRRAIVIQAATERANFGFEGYPLLKNTELKGKPVFFMENISDELVLRKICRNIHRVGGIKYPNRDELISNIKNIISEGVSYRIYRLDIKSFYESISPDHAMQLLDSLPELSIPTKRQVRQILNVHTQLGNSGLPRGIALSAMLAELVMNKFDHEVQSIDGVYYYGRFVDDIVVVTNKLEDEKNFVKSLRMLLPIGLGLNQNKQKIKTADKNVAPYKAPRAASEILRFDYLGYEFLVYEPLEDPKRKTGMHFRDVWLDISEAKMKKLKTRIINSLLDFSRNADFSLLEARLKYLTTNFSVLDVDRDRKRLAGIYHNYWQIDASRSTSLLQLDRFLRCAIISGSGPVFDRFYSASTDVQRRVLLTNSFSRGFVKKPYVYFSKRRIGQIQECWKYV